MAQIDTLFESIESEILDESVKLEMAVLFENQVTEAIKAKEAELIAENAKEVATFKETMVENLDAYCNHFAEEFTKKNQPAIVESVKVKTAERILKAFDGVMRDFSYELNEKKITVEDKLAESKKEINALTKQLIESKKAVKETEKAVMVMEASAMLETDVQKSKLVEYAKGQEFDDLFEKKVVAQAKILISEAKESKKKTEDKSKLVIAEEVESVITKPVSEVDKYVELMK